MKSFSSSNIITVEYNYLLAYCFNSKYIRNLSLLYPDISGLHSTVYILNSRYCQYKTYRRSINIDIHVFVPSHSNQGIKNGIFWENCK